MQITLLFNPIAGAGKATQAAHDIAESLARDGHDLTPIETAATGSNPALEALLPDSNLLIVVGGDGTVRMAAQACLPFRTPIWQVPFGTENLFAREFGMSRNLALLRNSLHSPQIVEMDVGRANGKLFLMMVSVGFDAEVIHDLASHRKGGITHLTYVGPLIRQILRWKPAAVRVRVDGEPVSTHAPGVTIVANARQYAFRLDPAPHASRDDGLIHLVHFPVRSKVSVPLLALRARMRRHLRNQSISRVSGRHLVLQYELPQRVQIDGDPMGQPTPRLEIGVHPQTLRVLKPRRL